MIRRCHIADGQNWEANGDGNRPKLPSW